MGKILFIPFSVVGGLIAGFLSQKIFELAWRLISNEEAPEPEHREVSVVKLVAALALEGAIFRAVRGLADHQSRRSFYKLTGSWPGEERPDQAD